MSQTYQQASRQTFVTDAITNEQIRVGCLQRIADAAELAARNHRELVNERDNYKGRIEQLMTQLERCDRQIAAYRGLVRKLKDQLKKQ